MWHTWAVPAARCPVGISECSLWLRGECVCVAVGHCPYFNPCICECVHTGAPSHRAAMTTCPCLLSSVPTQEAGDNGCISLHSELLLPPPHPALCGSQTWAGLGWEDPRAHSPRPSAAHEQRNLKRTQPSPRAPLDKAVVQGRDLGRVGDR